MAGNRQRDRGDGDDWGIRRLRTVAGAGRVSKSPQSSQTATGGASGEIGNMESEHHILPSSDVEELELRLESIGESTATGNLTLLGELHPTASYTERDGGRACPVYRIRMSSRSVIANRTCSACCAWVRAV